ncbi:MAG: hypothetical protein R6T93_02850 [Trueperaceae bacterium]
MRPLELSKVVALSLALVAPLGGARAQSAGSHRVSVAIPVVLRLRLDDGHLAPEGAIDVEVYARAGVTTIDPGTTRVAVRANTTWHLDARFRADTGSEALRLTGRLGDGPWLELCDGARLVTGDATRGWTVFEVAYGVAQVLADGNYRGTVVYTLTRP